MELTFGRRMLFATVCGVAVATIYAAQPSSPGSAAI